jgi:hypothetical protein
MAPFEQDYTDGNESLTISRRAAPARRWLLLNLLA